MLNIAAIIIWPVFVGAVIVILYYVLQFAILILVVLAFSSNGDEND